MKKYILEEIIFPVLPVILLSIMALAIIVFIGHAIYQKGYIKGESYATSNANNLPQQMGFVSAPCNQFYANSGWEFYNVKINLTGNCGTTSAAGDYWLNQ